MTVASAVAAISVVLTVFAISAQSAANAISNGSFERNIAGWQSSHANIAGWQSSHARLSRIRASDAPNGHYVAQVKYASKASVGLYQKGYAALTTSTRNTYTVSAYLKGLGNTVGKRVWLRVREYNPANLLVAQRSAKYAFGTAFAKVGYTFKAHAGSDRLRVWLVASPAAAGRSFEVDSIRLIRTSPSPSGRSMPAGDIPGWHQVFVDDFTKKVPLGRFPSAVAHAWGDSYPDGWPDTSRNGVYMPSKVVSISNSVMNLRLHTENGIHMVAAPVPTIPAAPGSEGGLLYGRYVVRFRADAVPGYKTAWLLWPDPKNWPEDGEIDFPEGDLSGDIGGFVHYQGGTSGSDQAAFDTDATYTRWHTATITWLPSRVTFQLDGTTLGTVTSRIPNTPMHWVIQTETSIGAAPPASSAAANVQIDWVAVYTPA
jgi:hypothetical protein